ncbi:hypothetical protein GPICK_07655 [Geobacter pickeringii]|uniref:Uncharacterized protein n=2 Tax=Geobacter pickeringii TaxID=345632 RepID=A0A0B5BDM4_9BACT|nr:hypothetical protein GPICK_07655 [Geobacter pickeringii]
MIAATDRDSWLKRNKRKFYPDHYEETHLEVLLAKEFMTERGFRSALFVSSPYHMRRIRMMADEELGKAGMTAQCVPYEDHARSFQLWMLSRPDFRWVITECAKIGWYLIYHKQVSA